MGETFPLDVVYQNRALSATSSRRGRLSRRHCVVRRGSRESERGNEWISGDDGMSDLGSRAMDDFLKTCETAARAGAQELLAWRGRFETREKSPADLVTDADVASQTAIRKVIATR